jgi:hypothetical protein
LPERRPSPDAGPMTGLALKRTEVPLPQLPAGWQLVTAAVLADGSLALLATNADLAQGWRLDPDVAARAETRLWCFDGKGLVDGPCFPLEALFPKIDRFDDGRWLVVASRTEGGPNARILAGDGKLLARLLLGDGVAHIGVDRRNQIWVGWFDEGVFGNGDWRVPDEEWPPSSRGIGLFSIDGSYRQLPAFPDVADCYALNIVDEGVWACAYEDFPLLHLRPDRPVRWWLNELEGPSALAVAEGHALLAGVYRGDRNRLALLALEGEGNGEPAQIVTEWRLPLAPRLPQPNEHPDVAARRPRQRPMLLTGRNDTIHLVQDGTWYRWRVSDGVTAANSVTNQS